MVCRNICRRLVSKPSFEYNQYILGKKYCRRCEVYIYHSGLFCPCCGMQLRRTPASKNGKERLRRKKKMLITNSQNWLTANSNYWLCYPPDLKEPLIWSASGRLKNDSIKIKFRTDFKSPILWEVTNDTIVLSLWKRRHGRQQDAYRPKSRYTHQ